MRFYNATSDTQQAVLKKVRQLSDEMVNNTAYPCFAQDNEKGHASCIMRLPRDAADMVEDMCPSCQLLYYVQTVEQQMVRAIRVQQMVEAGRWVPPSSSGDTKR